MPKKRSSRGRGPLGEINRSLKPVNNPAKCIEDPTETQVEGVDNIRSLLSDENSPKASSSSANLALSLSTDTAELHGELDIFRQRWKRELEGKKLDEKNPNGYRSETKERDLAQHSKLSNHQTGETKREIDARSHTACLKESFGLINNPSDDPKYIYKLAKKLFLIGVDLEQDELHNESIRYYKQAMHLCPNIEKQIFLEQIEASKALAKSSNLDSKSSEQKENHEISTEGDTVGDCKVSLLERIRLSRESQFSHCVPSSKIKSGAMHISKLPHDLILKLFHYVIGQELDLASLEQMGLVCKGFYLLSNDPLLWRSICYRTWGPEVFLSVDREISDRNQVNWKKIFLEKPRVNCDGVYISRTRYIRQGDVGFQDITYRPFHLIRYYRYIRFFTDKRVLILTTNEEPERVIPIFRQALSSKQFSPELSVLEGTYELTESNKVIIVAEKDFSKIESQLAQQSSRQAESRRQARINWSRQTPINQKFEMLFELKTNESRPYNNNVLKWCEYTISAKFDSGTEVTRFDITQDSFPNLLFSRVRRLNMRSSEPLTSH